MQCSIGRICNMISEISVEDFSSLEEYRKSIVLLNKQLSSKLKEGVETVLDENSLKEYIHNLMQSSYIRLDKLPPVPSELKVKERSKSSRNIFKEELLKYEYPDSPRLAKMIASSIQTSSSISELRSSLRLWKEVQLLYSERDKLQDEVSMLDAQISFDTQNEELLEFYIQQNRELVEALAKDDEEYLLARKVHHLHSEGKGRVFISNELNISEKRVRVLLDKYEFQGISSGPNGASF